MSGIIIRNILIGVLRPFLKTQTPNKAAEPTKSHGLLPIQRKGNDSKIAQRAREGSSSEAEIGHPLEGDANGPHAGLRRVLPFPLNGKQAVGLRGL